MSISKKIYVNNREISSEAPCYIIAEIGQAHDGSLGTAHAYIDAVAGTGVDAIKFQTHIAHAESTKHEQFRVKVFPQDATRYDYWKRMEFTPSQWESLAEHARSKGLEFLSTPFSNEAVDLLESINVPAWKIGSGDINNDSLLDKIISTNKPILLSSGMSTIAELTSAVNKITNANIDYAIFQCTTSYPCEPEEIGYNLIEELSSTFNCPVGLSDHSGTIYPSLASVTLGASIIEVHTVFSKHCFGPDTKSSVTIDELKNLVEGIRFIERGLKVKIDKNLAAEARSTVKGIFSRSAFYNFDLEKGTILKPEHIVMKKPSGGLSYEQALAFVGKNIGIDRKIDDFVTAGDFS